MGKELGNVWENRNLMRIFESGIEQGGLAVVDLDQMIRSTVTQSCTNQYTES
jgi:hypothetical protein